MDNETFLKLISGMPVKFLIEYPDGEQADIGGVMVTSPDNILEEIAAGLIGLGVDMMEKIPEHKQKCPHHTTNPSAN